MKMKLLSNHKIFLPEIFHIELVRQHEKRSCQECGARALIHKAQPAGTTPKSSSKFLFSHYGKCFFPSTLTLLPHHNSIPPEHFCEQVYGRLHLLSQRLLLFILIATVFREQLRMGLHCTRYCTNTQQDYIYRYIGVAQYQCFCGK